MICCKCKKPIDRSYGRVTDLGNYCYQCAMQNEIDARKEIVDLVDQARKEMAEKFAKLIFEKFSYDKLTHETDEDIEIGLTASELFELAKQFGVEIKE